MVIFLEKIFDKIRKKYADFKERKNKKMAKLNLKQKANHELVEKYRNEYFLKFPKPVKMPKNDSGVLFKLMNRGYFLYPVKFPLSTIRNWELKMGKRASTSLDMQRTSKKRINEHYYIYEMLKDLVVLQKVYEKKIAKKITFDDENFLIKVFQQQFRMSDYPEREIREAIESFDTFKRKMFVYLDDKMTLEQKERINKLEEIEFFIIMKKALKEMLW